MLVCQTKANKKKSIGITGIMSTSGTKKEKAVGNLLKRSVSMAI